MFKGRKGFTIIELLVVIMVIAILVGIAIPRFKGVQDEANISKAKAELKVLQTAVESYYMNQTPNAYPATSTTICASSLNAASPQIVAEVLQDPFRSAAEYVFRRSSNGSYYVIYSYGADRAQDITGIGTTGVLTGTNDDDIYATNGSGF
ncbi:MAG: type II secretion system protein GspG [Candidatus Omnitrophota bacterium]